MLGAKRTSFNEKYFSSSFLLIVVTKTSNLFLTLPYTPPRGKLSFHPQYAQVSQCPWPYWRTPSGLCCSPWGQGQTGVGCCCHTPSWREAPGVQSKIIIIFKGFVIFFNKNINLMNYIDRYRLILRFFVKLFPFDENRNF